MSIATLILGQSGTGKTASMRDMNPAQTFLIQTIRKPVSFKAPGWSYATKEHPNGNIFASDNSQTIICLMRKITRPVIVIDDFQYLLANEFMRRSEEKGYDKFTEIARHAWDVLTEASSLGNDTRVYVLSHTEEDQGGTTKIKTIGKLLDEKITPEGMFTTVLRTSVIDGDYAFTTQNNGRDTVKSPMGMFAEPRIPNDLAAVDKAIVNFYSITTKPSNQPTH